MVVCVAAAWQIMLQFSVFSSVLMSHFLEYTTENRASVQSHSGECHQRKTIGYRLPLVFKGSMAVKLAC